MDSESTTDSVRQDRSRDTVYSRNNDDTVQYFENELKSYKDQNKTLFEMIEEQKIQLEQSEGEGKRVKDELSRYKS